MSTRPPTVTIAALQGIGAHALALGQLSGLTPAEVATALTSSAGFLVDAVTPSEKPPTTMLLREFDRLHREAVGTPAVIQAGKDAKLIAGIWRSHGSDDVKTLMADYFRSKDPFIRDNGYSIGRFISQASKLLAQRLSTRRGMETYTEWTDECEQLHGGTCPSRYQHGLKMQEDV